MSDPFWVTEQVTLVTPFGVRFWDEVTGSTISDGLNVTAYLEASAVRQVRTQALRRIVSIRAPRFPAFPNRQGVYVLRNLPGLRRAQNGESDASFWVSEKRPSFVIEVVDSYRRFQPFSFTTKLPIRDLFTLQCGSVSSPPETTRRVVPLYSAPARRAPGAMAVLYADLWDLEVGIPASWAMLEAHIAGQPPVRGFADLDGHVVLIFPYPGTWEPALQSPTSPLGATTTALTQQEWPIQLQAYYTRLDPVPSLPDLCTTLTQQAATLWMDATRSQPLTGGTLTFGQERVVRSQDPTLPSVLLITPAASPP
jgi:hypothetical protein